MASVRPWEARWVQVERGKRVNSVEILLARANSSRCPLTFLCFRNRMPSYPPPFPFQPRRQTVRETMSPRRERERERERRLSPGRIMTRPFDLSRATPWPEDLPFRAADLYSNSRPVRCSLAKGILWISSPLNIYDILLLLFVSWCEIFLQLDAGRISLIARVEEKGLVNSKITRFILDCFFQSIE